MKINPCVLCNEEISPLNSGYVGSRLMVVKDGQHVHRACLEAHQKNCHYYNCMKCDFKCNICED